MNLCEELNINWRYCPRERQTQKERKDAGHLGKAEAKLWASPDWHSPLFGVAMLEEMCPHSPTCAIK